MASSFVFAELPENWADMQEPLLEGMCFTLKYLGMTLVEKPKGEDMAAAAIRRIVATVRPSPGALGCWGQSPAPALQESVCVLALNSSEGLCPSQEEGGMQEAAVCCGEAVFLQDSPSHLLPHLNLAGSRAVPAAARRRG